MVFTDALDSLKTLLEDNWDSSNTDSITPSFYANYSVKRVLDMGIQSAIVIYAPIQSLQRTNALGGQTRETKTPVTIEVITKVTRDHSINMLKEVERIISGNLINPDSNYDILNPDATSWRDFTDNYKLLFRWVGEVTLEKMNETRE